MKLHNDNNSIYSVYLDTKVPCNSGDLAELIGAILALYTLSFPDTEKLKAQAS
ncbi:MAG: hypothetical protein GY874_14215 [Desulfobacteraceae bacterium]|nr:hypothetical protein [Desulfobacteraceae bacterium]